MHVIGEYKATDGATVEVFYDTDEYNNPRDWDNAGTMYCWHGRYDLGDKKPAEADMYAKDLPEGSLVIWLYLYDHSGITMRAMTDSQVVGVTENIVPDKNPFSDPWDSGCVGYTFITLDDIEREFGGDYEKAEACLRSEVETYDTYLTGEVYGYSIYTHDKCGECGHNKSEFVDSLSGIFGTDGLKAELPEPAPGESLPIY